MYYNPNRKTMSDWMNDPTRPKTLTKMNTECLIRAKEVLSELNRNSIITYFLLNTCDMEEARTMFISGERQQKLLYALIKDLKKCGVEPEWRKVIMRDLESIHRRCVYVIEVCKENLLLTKYQPYFDANGFRTIDKVADSMLTKEADLYEEEEKAKAEISAWMERHEAEVEAYEKEIEPKRQMLEARRQRIKEQEKAEKKAIRDAKKAENAEIREMRENYRKHKARQKKIERSFARYYT